MASATWPVSLPQKPLQKGYSEQQDDNLLRSQVDAGPVMTRPRYTTTTINFTFQMVLTNMQSQILEAFFSNDLSYGSLKFDWVHPRTGATGEFRFLSPPKHTARDNNYWMSTMQVELLP